jgi:hypothetical protein
MDILKIHAGPISKKGDFGAQAAWCAACRRAARPAALCCATGQLICLARHLMVLSSCAFMGADWEAVVKLTEGFNGADMRNVCTEVRRG